VIPDVNAADVETPEFAGRVKVFGEFVDHHATEEEKTMFKMARQMFSAEERAQLDEEYETWKQSNATVNMLVAEKAKASLKGAAKSLLQ
jgi:hemerythrin-like domain-containing protein